MTARIDPALRQRITRYLLVESRLEPADLCLVFGTNFGCEAFADKAAEIYSKGLAKRFMVSGGVPAGEGSVESLHLKALMVERGIPADLILTETRATNTGENVRFSRPVVEGAIGLDGIRSVIGIGKIYAARRYLMTLAREWPGVKGMIAPINDFGVDASRWDEHPVLMRRVIEEWNKIPGYLVEGFIKEVRLPGESRPDTPSPADRIDPNPPAPPAVRPPAPTRAYATAAMR